MIPHQGLASHCTMISTSRSARSLDPDTHSWLALHLLSLVPLGWLCSSQGVATSPPTAVPGAGQSPRAVRQGDLSVCLAWCCCSLPAVSRRISRAQHRFPPEHGQHIPWQRGDTGGAAGALCPWGFTHGNCDSTEPLMLLLPPPAARGSGVAQESGTVLRAPGCRDTRWEGGLHLGSCQPPAECSTEHVGSARYTVLKT